MTYPWADTENCKAFGLEIDGVLGCQHVEGCFGDFVGGRAAPGVFSYLGYGT
jgi:hypothetical protein